MPVVGQHSIRSGVLGLVLAGDCVHVGPSNKLAILLFKGQFFGKIQRDLVGLAGANDNDSHLRLGYSENLMTAISAARERGRPVKSLKRVS